MSAPTGVLNWGQAGEFNAVDDRAVITALCNQRAGIVKAVTLTASAGLDVLVGPWLAVVSCGDGTYAVVRSADQTTVTPAAGGSSGSRTDVLWLDIDPDGSTWTLGLRTPADIVGRLGVELGRITVPANANLATAFTFAPHAVTYNPFPVPVQPARASGRVTATVASGGSASGTAVVTLPVGRFTTAPNIQVTSESTGAFWHPTIWNPTATSFSTAVRHINATATTSAASFVIHWSAEASS